jgi:hypothetical protein
MLTLFVTENIMASMHKYADDHREQEEAEESTVTVIEPPQK